jgi:hypothetical protein
MSDYKKWEEFEDWFDGVDDNEQYITCPFDSYPASFRHAHDGIRSFADECGLTSAEACEQHQAYLDEQRKRPRRNKAGKLVGGSLTSYHTHRKAGTRTRTAIWIKGESTKEARSIGKAFSNDVHRKAIIAFKPDLQRIAETNTRTA